jgi:MFS family permease
LRRAFAATTDPTAQLLVETRSLRGFADGLVSVLLASYLAELGFGARQIGLLTTMTLIGSAVATITLGLVAYRFQGRSLLITAAVLMALTGAGFLLIQDWWLLLPVAFVGTLNPSSGDVSVFLPLEQAEIARVVPAGQRTSVFARFSLGANLIGALGALSAGGLATVVLLFTDDRLRIGQVGFVIYGVVGLVLFGRYRRLATDEPVAEGQRPRTGLRKSRGIVLKLAAVFSIDSFGGGFVIQTMLILWLFEQHGMSEAQAGVLFFWTGICAALSMLIAPRLAARFGLIETMVFTHLPANLFLIAAALMPSLPLAVAMLILRALLSSMDIPARTTYVMSVVDPEERAAAASLTNVPRSLATAVSPAISGQLLALTTFGWPLIIAGSLKVTYDLLLLRMFRSIRPSTDT